MSDDPGFISFLPADDDQPSPSTPPMLEFPAELQQSDEGPSAPCMSEYPLGCVAGLLHVERAREIHGSFWEPIMEELFRQPGIKVTIVRHQNQQQDVKSDFTFVTAEMQDGLTVGCHVHRACLKEPKVKAERYTDLPEVSLPPAGSSVLGPPGKHPVPGRLAPMDEAMNLRFQKALSKGNSAFKQKKFDDALLQYNKAVTIASAKLPNSDRCRAHANRSAAQLALRDYPSALEDALTCLRLDPRNVQGYCRAGNVYRVIRQFERAEEMYCSALKLQPASEQIRTMQRENKASAYFRSKLASVSTGIEVAQVRDTFSVVTKITAEPGRTLFTERPTLAVGVPSQNRDSVSLWCAFCLRSLAKKAAVLDSIKSAKGKEFTAKHYEDNHSEVHCSHNCGTVYCSVSCRDLAWESFHCVECTSAGRWADGMNKLHLYCRNSPFSPMIQAQLFLAVRMLSSLAAQTSKGSLLKERSREVYRYLPQGSRNSKFETLLIGAHDALHESFTNEETTALNFVFFSACFAQVARGAIAFQCSSWASFLSIAETHLQLLQETKADEQHMSHLKEIVQLEAASIPGVVNKCIGLFDIMSCCSQESENMAANAVVRAATNIRSSKLHVVATLPVSRNADIVLDCFANKASVVSVPTKS